MKIKRALFDIEADHFLEDVTKIHCIVIIDLDTEGEYRFGPDEIEAGLEMLEDAEELLGHNIIKYDLPVLKKIYPEFNPKGQVIDTLILSRLIWSDMKVNHDKHMRKNRDFPRKLRGSHGLEAWGYVLGKRKGEFNQGEETDWSTYTPEMLDYCADDVQLNVRLYQLIESKNYSEQAIELEHKFAQLIWLQEQHGVKFDLDAAVSLYGTLQEAREKSRMTLMEIFPPVRLEMKKPAFWIMKNPRGKELQFDTKGLADAFRKTQGWKPKEVSLAKGPNAIKEIPFNPGSRQQIADRLIRKYNWKPTEFTEKGSVKVDDDIIGALEYPEAKPLTEFLTINKRIGQLAEGRKAWLKVEKDGWIHGSVITNGAVTGRCTHASPNMAQVPTVVSPYGKECRSLFIVPDGFSLVGFDASGLELRCLAHFMALYDSGAYAKILLEGDIHTSNQEAAGLPDRDVAKRFIYAFLYGAGNEKIGKVVSKGAAEGKRLRAKFLKSLPALDSLIRDVKLSAKRRGWLKGLDGRRVPVRAQHAALNSLLQHAGAMIMKQANVFLYEELTFEQGLKWGTDWAKVLDVHDEGQNQVRCGLEEQVGTTAVKCITRAGEHFGFRCPLDGEYKVGKNWAETH